MKNPAPLFLIPVVAVLGFGASGQGGSVALAATPPPTPPAITASPTPGASSAPSTMVNPLLPQQAPKPATPGATPTPPVDNRVGLEGVWEVQIQRGDITEYTHFNLKQAQAALTGTYLDKDGKRYPLTGSVDGQQIHLVVSLPDGATIVFAAKVDGTTDMLGLLTTAKENVPFTASYRPKEKWIENLNTQPGGIGGMNGGNGGLGGYPPPR